LFVDVKPYQYKYPVLVQNNEFDCNKVIIYKSNISVTKGLLQLNWKH